MIRQLIRCGIEPCMATTSNLIYDETTGKMFVIFRLQEILRALIFILFRRHISGFRMASPVDSSQKWSNTKYVTYGLAKRSRKTDWYNDETGWEF